MSTPIRITKEDLAQKVHEGWKKDALAQHYGLPVTQMTAALKQAGLTIRKFHKPKFVLIDETEQATQVVDIETFDDVDLPEVLDTEEAPSETIGPWDSIFSTEEQSPLVSPDPQIDLESSILELEEEARADAEAIAMMEEREANEEAKAMAQAQEAELAAEALANSLNRLVN